MRDTEIYGPHSIDYTYKYFDAVNGRDLGQILLWFMTVL